MRKKIRVAILFGGKSAEHEISWLSANNVYTAIDKDTYDVELIGIDKKGTWQLQSQHILQSLPSSLKEIQHTTQQLALSTNNIVTTQTLQTQQKIDVVFPVLHGPYGEDGSVQGLLKVANIPFVGSGVLGSAIGMDKDVMKRLFRDARLPIGNFLVLRENEKADFKKTEDKLGLPFFIKPANMGSSIGVSKVHDKEEFIKAIENAFQYDTKILVEQYIKGKEVECSILGNDDPIASLPGEIIANNEFYDYTSKYIDENGATLRIPANLTKKQIKEVQKLAIQAFQTLGLEGMARVDFFFTPENKFYLNEVNTIPGFTNISMYLKLWEASGISQTELIDRLIQLALERFAKQQHLKTTA